MEPASGATTVTAPVIACVTAPVIACQNTPDRTRRFLSWWVRAVLAGSVPGQGELAGQGVRVADAGQGGQGAHEGGIGPGPPGRWSGLWSGGGPGGGQDGVVPVAAGAVPDHHAVVEVAQPV